MELTPRHARTRLSELIAAPQRGRGSFFERLEAYHQRRGTEGSGERWPAAFNDPAFSRQVLGLEDDA